jgi:hypothetical protein
MNRWGDNYNSYFEDGDDIWWSNDRGDVRKLSKKDIYKQNIDEDLEKFLSGSINKEEKYKKYRITIDDLNIDDAKQRRELLEEYVYQLEKDIYEDLEAQFDDDYKTNQKQMEAEIAHLKEINEKNKFEVIQLQSENEKLRNKNQIFYETALKKVAQLKAFIKAVAAFNISHRKLEEEVTRQTRLQKNILHCMTLFGIENNEYKMSDQEYAEQPAEDLFSLDTFEDQDEFKKIREQDVFDLNDLDLDDL